MKTHIAKEQLQSCRVVDNFCWAIYTIETNSSIQIRWIQHLAFDTFCLFASHIFT